MFSQQKITKESTKILDMDSISEDRIVYSLAPGNIKFVDIQTKKTSVNIKTGRTKETLTLYCINHTKTLLAYLKDDYIYVVKTMLKRGTLSPSLDVLNKIKLTMVPTYLTFSPNAQYLFIGSEKNRVYQYKYSESQLLASFEELDSFKKRTSGITCIKFDDSQMFIAGNRGDLVSVNIYSKVVQKLFFNESIDIHDLLTLGNNRVISAHSNGELRYIQSDKHNVYTKIDTLFTKINNIVLMENKKYLLVCGREPYISLIDLEHKKNIMSKYLTFEDEVKQMILLSPYTLVVLLADNTIMRVNLPRPKQLESLIMHGSLDEAYSIVKKDPRLYTSKEYLNLETQYQEMLTRAIAEIPEQNRVYAEQTLSFFEDVSSKKKEITAVFKAFDNYKKFQDLFFAKEYSMAYNLVAMYPALESTREYRRLELDFKKTLQEAKDYLLNRQYTEAQGLLKKYMLAKPKQAILKLFLNKSHLFLEYLDVLKSKDIEKIQEIAQSNPVFAQYLKYLNIDVQNNAMKNILAILEINIETGKLLQAKKIVYDLDTLKGLDALEKYKEKIVCTGQLYFLSDAKNYLESYKLLDKYEFLQESDLGYKLERYWKSIIIKLENYAYKGDIKKVSALVKKYKTLEKRKEKLYEVLEVSYRIHITALKLEQAYEKLKNVSLNYLKIYGNNQYIEKVIRGLHTNSSYKIEIKEGLEVKEKKLFQKINLFGDKKK